MKILDLSYLKPLYNSGLIRAAGTYGFFSLINSAIPFLLLPIMTRFLTPEDYGIIAIFGVMVTLTIPFVGFSSHGAYGRAYFAPERFDSSIYMGTIVLFVFVTGAIMQLLFLASSHFLSGIFAFPWEWIWLIPIVAVSSVFAQITLSSWQVREQPKAYGFFQNGRSLSELSLAVLLVVLLGFGWKGRVISRVISSVAFAFIGVALSLKSGFMIFRFKVSYLLHGLRFGIPLIPHSLAGVLNTTIDRLFITRMVGISDTGLYTVGFQVGSIIGLIATAFNQAFVPWLFRNLNQGSPDKKSQIIKFTYLYFMVIIVSAIGLGLFAPLIMNILVGKEFQGSVIFVIWIALGYAATGMYYMVVNYIFYVEKTYLLAIATFLGALTNIALNYFFIRHNGAIGAAQATAITHMLTFLLVWYLSSKVYPMPWFSFWKKEGSL